LTGHVFALIVRQMTNNVALLDLCFHALADPSRRAAVARLADGPKSVTELFAPQSLSRPTMLQHVRVLEESGLITTQKAGRVRLCHLNRPRLSLVANWLDAQRSQWEARLDQFDAYVATMKEEETQ
jgi:DNA-binding transcriptional ArsR family regulator